jgi:hypothetical protein
VYRDAKGGWEPIGAFVPLNLRWSNTWDIAKTGEDAPGESKILTKERISEGGERLCDLGFIVEPSLYGEFCRHTRLRDRPRNPAPTDDAQARFHFAFEYIRDEERCRLMPGRYLLEIVADALRIRPRAFWLYLEIPSAIPKPKNDDERKKGLPGFHIQCHRKRPATRFTSPPGSVKRMHPYPSASCEPVRNIPVAGLGSFNLQVDGAAQRGVDLSDPLGSTESRTNVVDEGLLGGRDCAGRTEVP